MRRIVLKPASWCRHEYKSCPDGCPLEAAEGRLREAHRRWHECLDAYQSPEDFRDALNSAIQALRNVTFLLQAAKSKVPSFDSWYRREQEVMRADRVLRWVVEARNTVVKEADLSTHSWLRVKVVGGYHDEARAVRLDQDVWNELLTGDAQRVSETVISPPVATSPIDVLKSLDQLDLPLRVRKDSTLLLERRWVVDEMPDDELLTLMAHAYGRLRGVLSRCHGLLGLEPVRVSVSVIPDPSQPAKGELLSELPFGGRLPCMVSSRDRRTTRYRLLDGTEVQEFLSSEVSPDPSINSELLQATYGQMPPLPSEGMSGLQTTDELKRLVSWYGQVATGILRSGQDHGWFTYYFRQGRMVGNRVHMTTDAQGKHAIASEVSRAALESEADLVLLLSEIWYSPMDKTADGAFHPPGLHPQRQEALLVYAAARSGAEASLMIPFRVLSGEPPNRRLAISDPISDAVTDLGVLQPTRGVWGIGPPRRPGEAFFKRRG
jgi:hypothetical protein